MKKQIAIALLLALSAIALCGEPSAKTLLNTAGTAAKKEKKSVMVIFHASWCGWCHKLDDFLADPEMGKIMKKYFVIQHLDVMESPDKKNLENEGGDKVMEAFGGKNAGLPYTVMTDASGKMLINSYENGDKDNIGYPAKDNEIAHFMKMLKTSAPKMSTGDSTKIETWLKVHAPKN